MKIPERFYIGGQLVDVENVNNLQGKLGECSIAEGYIKIADTFDGHIQTKSSKDNTFVHELVHAVLDTMGQSDLSADEIFVNSFSGFLTEALRTAEYD